MGPDVVPVFIASIVVMSLCAPLHWLSLHATTVTIAQIVLIALLFFVLLVEADQRFGTTKDDSWIPAEALGGF